MSTCPLLRTAAFLQPARRASRASSRTDARVLLAIVSGIAGVFAWDALRDLLNAIPDSNDDFTFH